MNNKPIRIKKWEDLDTLKNDKYFIEFDRHLAAYIYTLGRKWATYINFVTTPQKTILSILRQFGFEVEFEKQVELTETDKDDVKFCLRHNLHYVAKNYNDIVSAFTNKPVRGIDYWFDPNTSGDIIPLNCGFSFLTWEHEPLYLDDLEV